MLNYEEPFTTYIIPVIYLVMYVELNSDRNSHVKRCHQAGMILSKKDMIFGTLFLLPLTISMLNYWTKPVQFQYNACLPYSFIPWYPDQFLS